MRQEDGFPTMEAGRKGAEGAALRPRNLAGVQPRQLLYNHRRQHHRQTFSLFCEGLCQTTNDFQTPRDKRIRGEKTRGSLPPDKRAGAALTPTAAPPSTPQQRTTVGRVAVAWQFCGSLAQPCVPPCLRPSVPPSASPQNLSLRRGSLALAPSTKDCVMGCGRVCHSGAMALVGVRCLFDVVQQLRKVSSARTTHFVSLHIARAIRVSCRHRRTFFAAPSSRTSNCWENPSHHHHHQRTINSTPSCSLQHVVHRQHNHSNHAPRRVAAHLRATQRLHSRPTAQRHRARDV